MKATEKKFDCVAMKRVGAARVYEQVKNMTPAQELAWWKKRELATKHRLDAKKKRVISK